jgi:hypothetical protein
MTGSPRITIANCWSVLDCERRAAALNASATAAVEALDELGHEAGMVGDDGSRCLEHQDVVNAMHALFVLVDHLLVNLKGGMAIPRTPTPNRAAERVDQRAAARQPVELLGAHVMRARGTAGRASNQATRLAVLEAARAEGLLNTEDARKATGYGAVTEATWYSHRAAKLIPEPHSKRAGMPFWTREQLAHLTYTPNPGRAGLDPATTDNKAAT